jgi:D-arginine dehydrogenase
VRTDVIVLGAGMAGASLAAELAGLASVVLLDTEDQAGRHATGRSAAMFFESYGNPTVRALTRASRHSLVHPPAGFAAHPLLTPRGCLFIADASRVHRLDAMRAEAAQPAALQRLNTAQALQKVPILRAEAVAAALFDPSGQDIDVAALHQGYLRVARRAGVQLGLGATEMAITRLGASWRVQSRAGDFSAPLLVNAAGAWADQVAAQVGAHRLGLQPMRRTALTVPAPAAHDIRQWPLVIDVDETFYFKPDAGQLLLSPANEDPMDPCDVMPEELDIAMAVDRFERCTTVQVQRVNHRWAGLRSFFADRTPVVGFDAHVEGFFWLAGQGGYGIQIAPALARMAAALISGRPLPADITDQGISAQALSPARARLKPAPSPDRQGSR